MGKIGIFHDVLLGGPWEDSAETLRPTWQQAAHDTNNYQTFRSADIANIVNKQLPLEPQRQVANDCNWNSGVTRRKKVLKAQKPYKGTIGSRASSHNKR